MFFTHKFMDEKAHDATVQANTIDMTGQYVLRIIRESFDTIGVPPHHGYEERVMERITTFVRENHETATMSDIADFLSLITDEEIIL